MKIKFHFTGVDFCLLLKREKKEKQLQSKEHGLNSLKKTKQESRKRHIRRLKQQIAKLQFKL